MSDRDEKWAELTPEEKLEKRFETWLSPPGVEFKSPEAGQAYRDRVTRIKDVIQLRVPDRVPVYMNGDFFPAYYAGISPEEAMYDYDKLSAAGMGAKLALLSLAKREEAQTIASRAGYIELAGNPGFKQTFIEASHIGRYRLKGGNREAVD